MLLGKPCPGLRFACLDLRRRIDSGRDGASKLLFQTAKGNPVETVLLRIASGRTTVCISSQSGCAAACSFCATGQMKLLQNLSAAEILDQVCQAGRIAASEGRRIRNLVFMGMGEPLHNMDALLEAIGGLVSADGFGFSPGRILVSTVGIPDGMRRLQQNFPGIGIALSLHSARDDMRDQLIPANRRHPLGELRQAIADCGRERPVFVEYLMLEEATDTDDDLAALTEYLSNLPVHINLIPFNPVDGAGYSGSSKERRQQFAEALRKRGFRVTVRYSLGSDIGAACGQLSRSG